MKIPENMKNNNNNKNIPCAEIRSFEVKNVRVYNQTIFFTLIANDITIYGCKVCADSNGKDFISFPSQKAKNNKWYNHVYVKFDSETEGQILAEVERQLNA